ncbi:MAG: CopG family transcriptional regulator [Chloroflexi bacterium]|jgi:Arc/MetJ-type ribon-helix-helix transcriptional regulator|nr:CopG family transcriptional regulator [Chloroflexota bacterium]
MMSETEKITINMSVVDLGKIDLLTEEGFYQNRTDFIRTAIRNQLDKHNTEVQSSVVRNAYGLGIFDWSRKELEKAVEKGERKSFNVIGMLVIEDNVSPELADQAIESIRIRGVFRASEAVKKILQDRIR